MHNVTKNLTALFVSLACAKNAAALGFTYDNVTAIADGVIKTDIVGNIDPAVVSAHRSEDLPGRILWIRSDSPITRRTDGTIQIDDMSGANNHVTSESAATTPKIITINGSRGFQFDGRNDALVVKRITPLSLSKQKTLNGAIEGHSYTYFVTACRDTSATWVDPTTGSYYNTLLSLVTRGGKNLDGSLNGGIINLMQLSQKPGSVVDLSNGAGSDAQQTDIPGSDCAIFAGRTTFGATQASTKSIKDHEIYSSGTPTKGTYTFKNVDLSGNRSSEPLTIGGDANPHRTTNMTIEEVQVFKQGLSNELINVEVEKMAQRNGVNVSFRFATVLQSQKLTAGTMPPPVTAECLASRGCVAKTTTDMRKLCLPKNPLFDVTTQACTGDLFTTPPTDVRGSWLVCAKNLAKDGRKSVCSTPPVKINFGSWQY